MHFLVKRSSHNCMTLKDLKVWCHANHLESYVVDLCLNRLSYFVWVCTHNIQKCYFTTTSTYNLFGDGIHHDPGTLVCPHSMIVVDLSHLKFYGPCIVQLDHLANWNRIMWRIRRRYREIKLLIPMLREGYWYMEAEWELISQVDIDRGQRDS